MGMTLNKYLASGNSTLSASFIAKESFGAEYEWIRSTEWVDGNGIRHPVFYPKRRLKVEFKTVPMDETSMTAFCLWFKERYTDHNALPITAWVESEQAYVTQTCDVSGLKPILDRKKSKNGVNIWLPMTIELSGRGQ